MSKRSKLIVWLICGILGTLCSCYSTIYFAAGENIGLSVFSCVFLIINAMCLGISLWEFITS